MELTELQDQVMTEAEKIRDEKYPGLPLCMDKFKSREELGSDDKIEKIGIEGAAQMILDDSLYWAGHFDGTAERVQEW